ncbi:hypothetical protein GGR57DRAFT_473658 [Xylariaceae sp. FL1272]|nr:hypothetical protein GGR57DRAFT_473658 [Xylariaceae sp. FL1272]
MNRACTEPVSQVSVRSALFLVASCVQALIPRRCRPLTNAPTTSAQALSKIRMPHIPARTMQPLTLRCGTQLQLLQSSLTPSWSVCTS